MSNRLSIDRTIKEKSTDFYYSASDMYNTGVFTNEFRADRDMIIQSKDNEYSYILNCMFAGQEQPVSPYESFEGQMFLGKQYETKYRDYSPNDGIVLNVVMCTLAGICSLLICMYITKLVKKK